MSWASILILKKFLVRDPGLLDVRVSPLILKMFLGGNPCLVDFLGVYLDLEDLTGTLFGVSLVLFFRLCLGCVDIWVRRLGCVALLQGAFHLFHPCLVLDYEFPDRWRHV